MALTDESLVTFLHQSEGYRYTTYDDKQPWKVLVPGDDVIGTLTYGSGFTTRPDGSALQIGDTITEQENFDRLRSYIAEEIEPVLVDLIHVPIAPSMANALGSLVFNFGASEVYQWRLWRRINAGEPPINIIREWVNGTFSSKGEPMLGLWRRRTKELLLAFQLDWRAGENVDWEDQPEDVMKTLGWGGEMPSPGIEPVLFDDDTLKIPTRGAQTVSTRDLNTAQLESREDHGRELGAEIVRETGAGVGAERKTVAITPITPKVPIEPVEYLDDKDKAPGNVTVKRVRDAQRGKGAIKQATGEKTALLGAAGSATVAIGAAEPVVKFVDKYPADTIAYVFAGLIIIGGLTIAYGKWQEQKGRDEAEDLMG